MECRGIPFPISDYIRLCHIIAIPTYTPHAQPTLPSLPLMGAVAVSGDDGRKAFSELRRAGRWLGRREAAF